MRKRRSSKRLWGRNSVELLEGGRRQDGHREQIQRTTPTGTGEGKPLSAKNAEPSFGATTSSRWPAGSRPSTSGWLWSMVKSSGAIRASLTSRLKYADSTRSTSRGVARHRRAVGNAIRTGGSSRPDRGALDEASPGRPSRSGNSLTLFALTTLPVSASRRRMGAITPESSLRELRLLEPLAAHRLDREPPQPDDRADAFTGCHRSPFI